VQLVRGFCDRLLDIAPGTLSTEGARVTELVACPRIAAFWPALAAVVQPLASALERSFRAENARAQRPQLYPNDGYFGGDPGQSLTQGKHDPVGAVVLGLVGAA
jgi:hypothetical protein